jgi:putative lipoic acid-binding regulatory protein
MKKTDPKDLLEFPCRYQFKAMGLSGTEFKEAVIAAVDKHVSVAADAVRCRPSGKGTYQAVSVLVTLHNYVQLTSIYAELRKIDNLKMLL